MFFVLSIGDGVLVWAAEQKQGNEMKTFTTKEQNMSCCVEVLTFDHIHQPVGYRLGRGQAGPEIVVLGHGEKMPAVCERLLNGAFMTSFNCKLTLLSLDSLPDMQPETLRDAIKAPSVDHVVLLPNGEPDDDTTAESYAAIVEACEAIGVIAMAA